MFASDSPDYFLPPGDRTRRTWMTRLDCSELQLVELLGEKQEIPVLELWHWLGQAKVWPDISRSLAAPPALRLEKLVLNDVGLTDQFVPHIIETLVNVRCRPSVIYDHLL